MGKDEEYEVGYGKPPRGRQFRPGQSGNPKGRPKGAQNVSTLIQRELEERVLVNENGKRRRISKRQAIAKQLVNRAAAGDPKAIPLILNEDRRSEAEQKGPPASPSPGPEDQLVMESIIRRMRLMAPDAQQPDPPADDVASRASDSTGKEV